ncbi:Phospholipid-transporting ATPase [Fusarium sp. LHS14.1]|nr:Phospholipid-transporting ATPase [Fusarium sp. LHS14.1]
MALKDLWQQYFVQLVLRQSPLVPSSNGRQIPLQLGRQQPLWDERRNAPYISNVIRTSRYTVFDFLPRQIFYQFSRLAHAYLLVVAILQVIPGLSTTGKLTTLIPLVIFVVLVIAKEGYYDWKRHRADVAENSRLASALRNSVPGGYLDWITVKWEALEVGDVIILSRDDDVPADIVLLFASGDNGLAHIDTMALDGETTLKAKQSPANLPDCSTMEGIATCQAHFSIEDPNADLYRFESSVTAGGKTLPVKLDEVIYRGSTIRNTPDVVGLVVNTGEECKVRMNANKDFKPKKPYLEHATNYIVLCLMSYVLALATVSTIGYFMGWKPGQEDRAWYLSGATVPFAEIFLGFIIMFNQVIPLSLYIGLEAIKLGQMSLIINDLAMYDENTDTPAGVNTTNNLDDLGQISYIFTDKTGTLTENVMNLRRLSVAGTSWLHRMDMSEAEAGSYRDSPTTEDMLEYIKTRPTSAFPVKAARYLLAVALCHTCIPEATENGDIEYQGSSPDEVALVRAAKEMGFIVTQRSSQAVTVSILGSTGRPDVQVFQILDVIEFDSNRKRLSIILQCPDGRIWLVCKGADTVLLPRLAEAPEDLKEWQQGSFDAGNSKLGPSVETENLWSGNYRPGTASTTDESGTSFLCRGQANNANEEFIPLRPRPSHNESPDSTAQTSGRPHRELLDNVEDLDSSDVIRRCFKQVDQFAVEGLRTLIYVDRFISPADYRAWKRQFSEAETSLHNRQQRITEVSELIEHSFSLIGASAVEDKLQDGVPETIEKLRRANIKICMLTGDKRETAINIAHSTRIMRSWVLHLLDFGRDTQYPEETSGHAAIVVDGKTLTAIEEPSAIDLRRLFYRLAQSVDSIICCRASPSQKALLVTSIRDGPPPETQLSRTQKIMSFFRGTRKPLTLAIGDGANDVSMILTASVGVGISGKEGQQASRVADFSISQFRFLSRLILVHGRHNYHRTTMFILTTFWKEIFIYLPQALFQDRAGVTGTSLYYPSSLIFVSFLTAASMVIIGTWEQDLNARTLEAVPELYAYGQRGEGLNVATFFSWAGNAFFAGLLVFQASFMGYADTDIIDDNGLFAQGTLVFIACIIWINCKILIFEMHHKTAIAVWSAIGSIAALWAYQLINTLSSGADSTPYVGKEGLIKTFGRDLAWWMTLIWIMLSLILVETILRSFKQHGLLRALLARCWPFGSQPGVGGGVREGFRDWETRLWQEMEKDPVVQRHLAKLHSD